MVFKMECKDRTFFLKDKIVIGYCSASGGMSLGFASFQLLVIDYWLIVICLVNWNLACPCEGRGQLVNS
jgi:hypothetical protein